MATPHKSKNMKEKNQTRNTAYDRLNRWFEKNNYRWLVGMLAIGLIASILSFDIKPSVDGDDTSYVLSAMRIVHSGQLPLGFRTPGYPIVLSLFIWMFGVNLVMLKATSLLFFLCIIVSLFYVFRNRLQPILLSSLLLLVAINPFMLKYSHQTFSEILFTLLLVWAIHFILLANERKATKYVLIAGIITMACFYVRTAGATIAGVALLFFAYQRHWKQLVVYLILCAALYSPMKIYELTSGSSAFGQASVLMLKNPYNTTEGSETVSGFIDRFINNIFNHANYQLPSTLGIPMPQELSVANGQFIPNASAFFGILVSIILLAGCIVPIVSKPKSMLAFLGFFVVAYVVFISVALQNIFATPRMLIPIIPYLIIGTLEGFSILGNRWAKVKDAEAVSTRAKTLIFIAVIGLTFANIVGAKQSIDENYPILKANIGGNELAGFTEDWTNYIRASLWIKAHLPMQSTGIICRKPELFLLYAGNYNVYGTYKIDQTNPDSIIAKWKSLNMTHLLYDDFQWTSTLRRYVQLVAEKYPLMFEMGHQEGSHYPSYVFRINYNAISDKSAVHKESSR
ncbi:MAG: glycosyltransferase family 39 protein [Ignavibacteriales bacterium]|nr:glycosyltransferase family 39 protein [Ignavibacteriales bacterium]